MHTETPRIHYVYRTIIPSTQEFYIGCRSHPTPSMDKYLGSGKTLRKRLEQFPLEYFEKEILFEFNTRKEAESKENEIVTSALLRNHKCLNIAPGGQGGRYGCKCSDKHKRQISSCNSGKVVVRDKLGNTFRVSIDDKRYINGEVVPACKGFKHSEETRKHFSESHIGKTQSKEAIKNRIESLKRHGQRTYSKESIKKLSDTHKGKICVQDSYGHKFKIKKDDPRYLSGELICITSGKKGVVVVKDKFGKVFAINKNDTKYLSHEVIPVATGYRHSEERRRKIGDSQRGCVFVNNSISNKRIKKSELDNYINKGWNLGMIKRKIKEQP